MRRVACYARDTRFAIIHRSRYYNDLAVSPWRSVLYGTHAEVDFHLGKWRNW